MMQDSDKLATWTLPDVGEDDNQEDSTTLFGKPADWYNSSLPKEQAEEEESPPVLTIEDIEAIRQSAYEDGFKEGKEAGFEQGSEEGKEQGIKEGHQQGLEQGIQEGLEKGQEQIDAQVQLWQTLIDKLHAPLAQLDENVEYQLVRLATQLAEQVCRSEVLTNPQVILQALKQSVDALPVSEQTLKIALHPDDLQIVQAAYSQELCLKRGWDLQAEPALARGDCQIHSQTSSVDYAFTTRIEQMLKQFFKDNIQQLPAQRDDSSLLVEQDHQANDVLQTNAEVNTEAEEFIATEENTAQGGLNE